MSRGMRPGDKNSMKTYLAHKESIDNEYEELARYEARQSPFDMYNKYTFVGSMAYSFSLGHGSESPFTKTIGTLLGMIPTALKTATNSTASAFYHIQPLTFDEERLIGVGLLGALEPALVFRMGAQQPRDFRPGFRRKLLPGEMGDQPMATGIPRQRGQGQ